MSDLSMYLVKAAIIVAITITMRYFIPWIKEKIEASKYAWISKWVGDAVQAMEQTIKASGSGPERKAKVVEFIKKLLIKKNISVSDEQLDTLIEAAVWALNNGKGDAE